MKLKFYCKNTKLFTFRPLPPANFFGPLRRVRVVSPSPAAGTEATAAPRPCRGSSRLLASTFTVASRFRRNFVGSDLSTIEAVGAGSWLSVVQVLDRAIGCYHRVPWWDTAGIPHNFIEFFFVKRYMGSHVASARGERIFASTGPPKVFFSVEKSTPPFKKILWGVNKLIFPRKTSIRWFLDRCQPT